MDREFDTPWKETLEQFLKEFLEYFFPIVYGLIDWSFTPENLDTELQQLVREGELGRTVADRLFRVKRKDGAGDIYLLIHTEVQNQRDEDLPHRMFVYHYRIKDRYGQHPIGLAILGDTSTNWRPNQYDWREGDTQINYQFNTVKLWDWRDRINELETSTNLISLAVLAHLQSHLTVDDDARRFEWKRRLLRLLYDRGWEREEIHRMYIIVDWFLNLRAEFEQTLYREILEWKKENTVPRVSNYERFLKEDFRNEGMKRILTNMLKAKFGTEGLAFADTELASLDESALDRMSVALISANTIPELRAAINQ